MTFDIVATSEAIANEHRIDNLTIAMERGIRHGFFAVGSQLRKTARAQMMEKPKSGRLYRIRRGKVSRLHRASAAGESPANLSGKLRRSIGFQIHNTSMEFGAGGRDSGVNYAKYLEDDLDRPLLQNAVKKDQGTIEALFYQHVGGAISQ